MSATHTVDRLHALMLNVYGKRPEKMCRDCVRLVSADRGRPVCELAKNEKGDWRAYLMACGKFQGRGAA